MTTAAIKAHIDTWLNAQLERDADARDGGDAAWPAEFNSNLSGFPMLTSHLGEVTSFQASEEQIAIARRHAEEMLNELGLGGGRGQLRTAFQIVLQAQAELFHAVGDRDRQSWDPWRDNDPAARLRLRTVLPTSFPASSGAATAQRCNAADTGNIKVESFRDAAREAIRELARSHGFKPKRVEDYESAVRTFVDWTGSEPNLGDVSPELAGRYKVDLTYFPSNAHKRLPYRNLDGFGSILAEARRLEEPQVLSATTINTKYLTPLRRIYEWKRSAGANVINPFEGIQLSKPKRKDAKGRRRDFSSAEVRGLFALPLFTGAAADSGAALFEYGAVRVSDWRYWVPIICLFSGMRLNEACGLALADLREQDGVSYFHIRDELEGQSLKSSAARRKVPLHRSLIDVGLLDHVRTLRNEGAERLFPELRPDKDGYFSARPSRFYQRVLARIADDEPDEAGKLTFHSSRHTVMTRLRSAAVREDVSREIVGHEQDNVHAGYGSYDIPTLKRAVDLISYEGLDLTRVRLPQAMS